LSCETISTPSFGSLPLGSDGSVRPTPDALDESEQPPASHDKTNIDETTSPTRLRVRIAGAGYSTFMDIRASGCEEK